MLKSNQKMFFATYRMSDSTNTTNMIVQKRGPPHGPPHGTIQHCIAISFLGYEPTEGVCPTPSPIV